MPSSVELEDILVHKCNDVLHALAFGIQRGIASEPRRIFANLLAPLQFNSRINRLRQLLEEMLDSTTNTLTVDRLRKMYGQKLYKCRRPFCIASTIEGFKTKAERQKHESRHYLPYKCKVECAMSDHPSKSALQRHIKQYHEFTKKRILKSLEEGMVNPICPIYEFVKLI